MAAKTVGGSISIAVRAFKSFFASVDRMPLLFGSTLIAAVLVEFCIAAATTALPPDYRFLVETRNSVTRSFEQIVLAKLFQFSRFFARAIVFAPLAVAVHRLIILDEVTPGYLSLSHPRTRRFVLWIVLVQLIIAAPSLLPQPSPASFWVGLPGLVLFVLTYIACVRLTLIFPAIAVGSRHQAFNQIWVFTRRRFWRIAMPGIAAFLPIIGITTIFLMWRAGSVTGWRTFVYEQQFRSLITQMPDILMRASLGTLTAGLGAAVASWLYVALLADDPCFPNQNTAAA